MAQEGDRVVPKAMSAQENWILPLPVKDEMTFLSVGFHQVKKSSSDWDGVLLPWTVLGRRPLGSSPGYSLDSCQEWPGNLGLGCPGIY